MMGRTKEEKVAGRLIDIGANLMHESFDRDREKVVASAEKEGVSSIVITGSCEKDSAAAQKYAASCRQGVCFATAGIHPHNAKDYALRAEDAAKTLERLSILAEMREVVAVGECGLDFNRNFSPREAQIFWFERQIELACGLGLPLFLHERDASSDFTGILRAFAGRIPKMVVHCFTGDERALDEYVGLGCYIGITGWICDERRGKNLLSLVKKVPSNRLLLETDAPYLFPRPLAGKHSRNEPKNLGFIARFVADALGKSFEVLAEETYENTKTFFNLSV